MSKTIAIVLAALAGAVMVVGRFLTPTEGLGEIAIDWFNILAGIAFVLGGGSLVKINLAKISAREKGWGFSLITILAFATMLTIGLLKVGVHPSELNPDVAFSGKKDAEGSAFWWGYEYVMSPITSTLFAMLAFYVASAAFRAFRAKNTEAVMLLGTAFIVLLGSVYAGVLLTDWIPTEGPVGDWVKWMRMESIRLYIVSIFNGAGTRAMLMGIAIGVAATSLKIMLGLDRSYLGSRD